MTGDFQSTILAMEQMQPSRIGLEETLRSLSLSSESPRLPARGTRYTSFVRFMRGCLSFLAVAMIVVIFTWDESNQKIPAVSKEDLLSTQEAVQNELIDPVFNSRDDKGQAYQIKATRAVQDKIKQTQVFLDVPQATLEINGGGKLDVSAHEALYEQDKKKLNLQGDVILVYSEGYTLSTQELRVDLERQKAYSGKDVRLEGEAGTLDAAGMEGDVSSGIVVFSGPARILLRQKETEFVGKTPNAAQTNNTEGHKTQ